MGTSPFLRRPAVRVITALAFPALLVACSGDRPTSGAPAATASATATPAPTVSAVQARVGDLVVGDGWLREPASPEVAAGYLTVLNTGDADVRLVEVTSDAAATVMPMTETTDGSVGRMTALDEVVVPAHGSFRFRPRGAHLMFDRLHRAPVAGETVSLSLTFEPGGTVTVPVPVAPITASAAPSASSDG